MIASLPFVLAILLPPLGFVLGMICGLDLSERWWEREAVRRGHGEYDKDHVFHWKQ